jgi:4-hydroxythreonine-4-phosphate dehydrogenase
MNPPETRLRIGITVGDPAGIGPEVVTQALQAGAHGLASVRVYGDLTAVERAGALPADITGVHIASAEVTPGKPDPAAAHGVVEAIRRAARDCMAAELHAMVTAPISKEVIGRAGYSYPGHTELLAELAGASRAVMLLVGGKLRVGLATIHCPLREVPDRLSTPELVEVLEIMQRDLSQRFMIARPRIAVCGLNPHAGDGTRGGHRRPRSLCRGQPFPPRGRGGVRCGAGHVP